MMSLINLIPIAVPIAVYAPHQILYSMSRYSAIMYKNTFDKEPNIIMNIPDADATWGGTLKLRSKGLKITPPPRPTVPAMNPATNAETTNLMRRFSSHLRSPSTKL